MKKRIVAFSCCVLAIAVSVLSAQSAHAARANAVDLPKEIVITYWGYFLQLTKIKADPTGQAPYVKDADVGKPQLATFWFTEGDARSAGNKAKDARLLMLKALGFSTCANNKGTPPCLGFLMTPTKITIKIPCSLESVGLDATPEAVATSALPSDGESRATGFDLPSIDTGSCNGEPQVTFEDAASEL